MENHPEINTIRECAHNLLTCANDFLIMKQSVDRLFSVFSEITGVSKDNFNNELIFLASGKAISPSYAALCLLEMSRTAKFLRGINKAIKQKQSEITNRPLQILYAGTGPYGTLLLPLMSIYSPEDFQVDLLDINEISKNALEKLIGELGLEQFIGESYLCDATTFTSEKEYDLVISETMQAALKKEPQVAIMQNLIPQMGSDVIFIPEAITISATLQSRWYLNPEKEVDTNFKVLIEKDLFTVDKHHLDLNDYHNELILRDPVGECNKLVLNTVISVFKDEVLKDSDCSLTLPLKVCELNNDQTGKISFWYEQGELPGVRVQLSDSEKVIRPVGVRDRNNW
jgi:hypothetical protein